MNDFFLRHYMGQTPGTSSTNWTASPDIIPNNTVPADVSQLVTQAGYNTEPPSTITLNQSNYVYVRGLNTSLNQINVRLWLYYAQSNVVQWPQGWGSSGILVGAIPQNYQEITVAAKTIAAAPLPFVWTPQPFTNGDHYCLVAFSENPMSENPIVSPKPSIAFNTWNDLASYVIHTPNMAWRNTIAVSSATPDWQITLPIAGAEGGGDFSVGFACSQMPTDGFLQVEVPGPDADNTINFPKTQIPKPNYSLMSMVTWPPKFNSSITINWWKGATNPPTGANITSLTAYPWTALLNERPHLARIQAQTQVKLLRLLTFESPAMENAKTTSMVLMGSLPLRF